MNETTIRIEAGGKHLDLANSYRMGNEDLLLFVHGLGCSKEGFSGAWQDSHLQQYSLLAFDLLGFGDSPKPDDFSYTVEDHADILAQVIDQYPNSRIHLVANSWGPIIGLQLSSELLAKLASFVNLEGRMVIGDVGNARKAAALSFKDFEQTFFPEMKDKYRNDPKTAYQLEKALPKAYYNGGKSIVDVVSRGKLPSMFLNLSCAKAYVYGDQNKHLQSIGALSGVEMIEVSGSGHFMMKDNPAEFYSKLATFLAK